MKCEIARDLLTLYAENLCSEESANALEEHLSSCPECTALLEKYRKDLKIDKEKATHKNAEEANKTLKPLKKLKGSLLRRSLVIAAVSLVLLVVLGVVGFLGYGEISKQGYSFSMIADAINAKKACKALAEGDASPLTDMMVCNFSEFYVARSKFGDYETYLETSKKCMEQAAAYYFKDKDIDVRIDYVLPQYGQSEIYNGVVVDDYLSYEIEIGFYEQNTCLYTLYFDRSATGRLSIYDSVEDALPSVTGSMFGTDDLILEITAVHSVDKQYEKILAGEEADHLGNGLNLLVRDSADQQDFSGSEAFFEKTDLLYENGWLIKTCRYRRSDFDEDAGVWRYCFWTLYENQNDGSLCMTEQIFHRRDTNLYTIPGEKAYVLLSNGEVDAESLEAMETLFE